MAESKAFGVPTRLGGTALEKTVRSYTASLLTILSEESPESGQGLFFLLLLVLGRFLVLLLCLRWRGRRCSWSRHHLTRRLQSLIDIDIGQCRDESLDLGFLFFPIYVCNY